MTTSTRCALIGAFLSALAASAHAQLAYGVSYSATYEDTTRQRTPNGSFASYAPGGLDAAAIGGAAYDSARVIVTWSGIDVKLRFETAFQPNSTYKLADVLFDLEGGTAFDTGLALTRHIATQSWRGTTYTTAGGLYEDATFRKASDSLFSNGSTYGKFWENPFTPGASIESQVWVKTGTRVGTFAVTSGQVPGGSGNDKYFYEVTLAGVNDTGAWNNFSLYWGTATCGNDALFTEADLFLDTPLLPEPSTYGMIGALGLAGLIVARRQRRARAS